MTMPATILDVQGLRRRFGSTEAVAGVDLRVAAGETVALLGPNGAGKSTTLAMILGLLPATAGQVTIDGRTPRQAVADGLVGALLQSGAGSGLPSGTRVGELVGFVASLYPAPLAPPAVLRHAGLASLAGHRLHRLSGGERQRVRFALAICGDPRLLILDEPTVGLDVPSRRAFWKTVRAFAAEGCAVLFATHYLAEAAESAGRVVVLHKGHVAADGTVDEIRRTVAIRTVRFRAPDAGPGAPRALRALPAVEQVRQDGYVISLDSTDADATVRGLVGSGTAFTDLEVTGAGLEDAFLALTSEEYA
jgi:ABC-2 type transport system ATP-binding protein